MSKERRAKSQRLCASLFALTFRSIPAWFALSAADAQPQPLSHATFRLVDRSRVGKRPCKAFLNQPLPHDKVQPSFPDGLSHLSDRQFALRAPAFAFARRCRYP